MGWKVTCTLEAGQGARKRNVKLGPEIEAGIEGGRPKTHRSGWAGTGRAGQEENRERFKV